MKKKHLSALLENIASWNSKAVADRDFGAERRLHHSIHSYGISSSGGTQPYLSPSMPMK